MKLDACWRRFLGMLLASFLLHAALILAPYLGTTVAGSQAGERGRPRTLNATLARAVEPADPAAEKPAPLPNPAELPAPAPATAEPPPAPGATLGNDVLPIPAPAYYTSDKLTRRPQPVSPPKLDLPQQLAPSFSSGKVILKLWINELGAVTSVDVEQSDLPEAVSAVAVAAFAKLKFVPGELNGRPVGTLMRIEVTYDDLKPPQ